MCGWSDFSNSPVGFFNPGLRNNAVSYFIGLDSYVLRGSLPWNLGPTVPTALGGDRNLQVDVLNVACSSGVTLAAAVYGDRSFTKWTNAVHGLVGNVLLTDGQVFQTPSARVAQTIAYTGDDNSSNHLLLPR